MRISPSLRATLHQLPLWAVCLLVAFGLGVELGHPGHHVHSDGEHQLHHHHFFVGDHSHSGASGGFDHHDHGADRGDRDDGQRPKPGSDGTTGSVLIDALWSESAAPAETLSAQTPDAAGVEAHLGFERPSSHTGRPSQARAPPSTRLA
ncbi:MAG: hypothetical protein AAFX50_17270 [Acidobacteriota bacterium]